MQELLKAEVEQVLRRTQPCWNGAPQMKWGQTHPSA